MKACVIIAVAIALVAGAAGAQTAPPSAQVISRVRAAHDAEVAKITAATRATQEAIAKRALENRERPR